MSLYQDKKVLVTGSAGFIGSHLVDRLLEFGAVVTGVDNFISGNRSNIEHLAGNPRFSFIEADVSNSPSTYLEPSRLNLVPDLVFHFASPASPIGYQSHPIETYLVNSVGTHHLLQYLHTTNPKARFLFASTSEVYGDPLEHPQRESYWGNVNPNGVRSMYDEAKRLGETICGVHERDFSMDIRIVRIFNTYGPRMDLSDGRVIPDFFKSILTGTSITIDGDGSQTRSFCYVDDLVSGVIKLMEGENSKGETVNLGNPNEITIKELAEVMQAMTQKNVGITYISRRSDDPARRCPDITKAKLLLGWEPTVDLRSGLRKTYEFFKQLDK